MLSIRYAVPVAYKSWYQHKNRRKVSVGEATPRKLTKASAERKKKEPDGIFLSIAATTVSEEGEVEETRGLRGGELSPRSSPTPSPEVFLSPPPTPEKTGDQSYPASVVNKPGLQGRVCVRK